jgi:hypothetical protein
MATDSDTPLFSRLAGRCTALEMILGEVIKVLTPEQQEYLASVIREITSVDERESDHAGAVRETAEHIRRHDNLGGG